MTEYEHSQEEPSTLSVLFRQLPRASAPVNFEETTLLRRLIGELPRASAPTEFEERVLSALRKNRKCRRIRLRWPRSSRSWLAVGVGAAIIAAITYYFLSRTTAVNHTEVPSAPMVLPFTLPKDTSVEEKISPLPQTPVRPRLQKNERSSTAPTKTVTPGIPEHDDE